MDKVEIGIAVNVDRADVVKRLNDDLRLLGSTAKGQSSNLDLVTASLREQRAAADSLFASYQKLNSLSGQFVANNGKAARSASDLATAEEKAAERSVVAAERRARAAERASVAAQRQAIAPAASGTTPLLGSSSGAGLGSAATGISAIGASAAGTALLLGAVTAGLYGMTAAAAADARELDNFAQRLGVTDTQARSLQIASKLTGLEFRSLEQSARVLAAGLEDPAGSGKHTAQALRDIGVATEGSKGEVREMGPVLLEFLSKLSGISSQTERVRLATEVLGRGAKEILPLINSYSDLQRVVQQFGSTLDNSATAELLKADRAIREATASYEELKRSLAAKIAPITINITRRITDLFNGTTGKDPQTIGQSYLHSEAGTNLSLLNSEIQPKTPGVPAELNRDATFYGKQAAETFRARRAATQEGIEERLRDLRSGADSPEKGDYSLNTLAGKLADPSLTDRTARNSLQSQYDSKSAQEKSLNAQLEALRKYKSDRESIQHELDSLDAQAATAEALGVEKVEARRDALIKKLREQHATQMDINHAVGDFNRIEAAAQAQQDDAVRRRRASEELSVRRDSASRTIEFNRRVTRAGFGQDGTNSDAAIQSDYDTAIQQADNNKGFAYAAALQERDPTKRTELFDKADSDRVKAAQDAEYSRALALFELYQKISKDRADYAQKSADALKEAGRSELVKNFDTAGKLATLRAPFGAEPLAQQTAYKQQLQLAQQIYALDVADALEKTKGDAQRIALQKAYLDLQSKEMDAEREHELAMAEYAKKRYDDARAFGGQIFDAVASKNPGQGITQFIEGQARNIGRTLFSNLFAEITGGNNPLRTGSLGGLIKGQTETDSQNHTQLTKLGRVLAGTPLGVDTSKIALQEQATTVRENTTAVQELTAAMRSVGRVGTTGSAGGGLGDIFGKAGLGTIGDIGAPDLGAPTDAQLPGNDSTLQDVFQQNSDSLPGGGGGFNLAGAAGMAAGIGAGALGIISGIKQGGARGVLGAVSGGLTIAATVDPEPISKAALAVGAIATKFISGIIGDPRQERDQNETEKLQQEAYLGPQQINSSTDVFGYDTNTNKYGQYRSTQFQGQTVSNSYFAKWNDGYYQIPGAVLEPGQTGYSYPSPSGQTPAASPTVNVNISAMDSKSILDRSSDIGAAVIQELTNGGAVGSAIQSKVLS